MLILIDILSQYWLAIRSSIAKFPSKKKPLHLLGDSDKKALDAQTKHRIE